MANSTASTRANRSSDGDGDGRAVHVHTDETKPSWKSTELWVYAGAVIAVLIASQAVGDGNRNNGDDYFAADKAWWYITLLTVAYLISRGLAKSGSRDHYDADHH